MKRLTIIALIVLLISGLFVACDQDKIADDEFDSKVTITFDANGGSGSMNKASVEKGSSYKLPACTFTPPEGKEFDKWDQGAPGASIKVTGDMTIKAVWKDKPEAKDQGQSVEDKQTPPAKEAPEIIDPKQKSSSVSKLKAGKKDITVAWKKLKNKELKKIKGYEIQYSTDKHFRKNVITKVISKKKKSFKIKKLKHGKKYYVRMRTYKSTGSEKIYSKWSKTKSIKTKK